MNESTLTSGIVCLSLHSAVLFCSALLCFSLFWLSNSIHMNTTGYGVRAAYSIFTAFSMHASSDPSRRFLLETLLLVLYAYIKCSTSLLIFILNFVNSLYKKVLWSSSLWEEPVTRKKKEILNYKIHIIWRWQLCYCEREYYGTRQEKDNE